MTRYVVTTEIKTPWWKKVLRFFDIIDPQERFELVLVYSHFKVGDILDSGGKGNMVKILKRTYEEW